MTNESVNVIVVNDKDGYLKSMLDGINGSVFSFIPSSSPKETLESIKGFSPDLIMIAISAKTGNDLLLCRELKRDASTRDIPVVFVSKERHEDSLEKTAFVYGCIDFLDADLSKEDMTHRLSYYASVGRIERGLKGILSRLEGAEENARCSL